MSKKANFIIFSITFIILSIIIWSILTADLRLINKETLSYLPKLNAILNALSFTMLSLALIAIAQQKIKLHVTFIFSALFFTGMFLISYLIYHFSTPPTKFQGVGMVKIIYLFILFTHIILAAIILPLVMFTILKALQKEYTAHKKLAHFTAPLWLYVSLTGVLIYLFNSAYY